MKCLPRTPCDSPTAKRLNVAPALRFLRESLAVGNPSFAQLASKAIGLEPFSAGSYPTYVYCRLCPLLSRGESTVALRPIATLLFVLICAPGLALDATNLQPPQNSTSPYRPPSALAVQNPYLQPRLAPDLAPVERSALRQESASLATLAPAQPTIIQTVVPPTLVERSSESDVYVRFDYFHWNEQIGGVDFVNENGLLSTLGYVHRYGNERVRGELFGGQVGYDGGVQYDDGSYEPLQSHTNYIGFRGELEFLFEPDWAPAVTFFSGIGSRFWFRNLPDDIAPSGTFVTGYEETWWSIYPYIGIEKRRDLDDGLEFYGSGRFGLTPFTYQHVSLDDTILYPRLGVTGQLEGGIRGQHAMLGGYFDATTWHQSAVVRGSLQPNSKMLLLGLKTGFTF